jgi:hypothetical protein
MKTITPTGQDKVLAVLKTGVALTAKQIEARFGVGNARMKGFAIYCNESVDTKGRVKNKYRLGTPSRKVVAAGYRALAKASV